MLLKEMPSHIVQLGTYQATNNLHLFICNIATQYPCNSRIEAMKVKNNPLKCFVKGYNKLHKAYFPDGDPVIDPCSSILCHELNNLCQIPLRTKCSPACLTPFSYSAYLWLSSHFMEEETQKGSTVMSVWPKRKKQNWVFFCPINTFIN